MRRGYEITELFKRTRLHAIIINRNKPGNIYKMKGRTRARKDTRERLLRFARNDNEERLLRSSSSPHGAEVADSGLTPLRLTLAMTMRRRDCFALLAMTLSADARNDTGERLLRLTLAMTMRRDCFASLAMTRGGEIASLCSQ